MEVVMHDTTVYTIMVFSPVIYWQMFLNIRYTIVYTHLRSKHSKTFLKKHSASWISWLFLKKFKQELRKVWYYTNTCLVYLVFLRTLVAIVYLILWLSGHAISIMLIPYTFFSIDMFCIISLTITQVCNKIQEQRK